MKVVTKYACMAAALLILVKLACLVRPAWCVEAGEEARALIAVQEARVPALKVQLDEMRAAGTPGSLPASGPAHCRTLLRLLPR